ncbi:MAG: hypothetical protein JNK12_03370 [Acidimicrobiales bacterium]|nr:hypothetical protein [Acidimicrobiales bacterium]
MVESGGTSLPGESAGTQSDQVVMQVGPFFGVRFLQIGEERERTEGLDEPNDILAVAGSLLRCAEVQGDVRHLPGEERACRRQPDHATVGIRLRDQPHPLRTSCQQQAERWDEQHESVRIFDALIHSAGSGDVDPVGEKVHEQWEPLEATGMLRIRLDCVHGGERIPSGPSIATEEKVEVPGGPNRRSGHAQPTPDRPTSDEHDSPG